MSDLEIGALPDRRRLALALLAGVIAGVVCWLAYLLPPPSTSDFEPVWSGARALISGRDPYAVVPTGGTRYPLYYPLPAVILGLPFGALPFPAARVLWAGLSGAVFLLAALRYRRGMLTALLSANLLNALVQGQWSPLLTAAAGFPALSWGWADVGYVVIDVSTDEAQAVDRRGPVRGVSQSAGSPGRAIDACGLAGRVSELAIPLDRGFT